MIWENVSNILSNFLIFHEQTLIGVEKVNKKRGGKKLKSKWYLFIFIV